MSIFAALIAIVESALSIWASKEKTKYVDEAMAIKKAYYAEENKPEGVRSDAVMDNLKFRYKTLALGLAVEMGTKS